MNRLPKRLTNIHHMIILLLVILLFFPTETLHSQDDDESIKALWGDDEEEENLDWLDEEIDILGIEEKDEKKEEEKGIYDYSKTESRNEYQAVRVTNPGFTIGFIGSLPSYVKDTAGMNIVQYNTGIDFKLVFETPYQFQWLGITYRPGLEIGTFDFKKTNPFNEQYTGMMVTATLSIPAGPGKFKLGTGMIGSNFGFTLENSYGLSLGDVFKLSLGIRSTTAFSVVVDSPGDPEDPANNLGNVSWIDGLLIIGINL